MSATRPVGTESGDRDRFLARARARLARGIPANRAHPTPGPLEEVPEIAYQDPPADLVARFEAAATAVDARVQRVAGAEVGEDVIRELIERHEVEAAVVTGEPEAVAVGEILAGAGVAVAECRSDRAAAADLGVTGAVAGIALTGSVVVDSRYADRTASLLPRVHLCVLGADRLVATPAAVLRPLGDGRALPSNLVLITGPSRTGDIEQIITLGVHGPTAVEIVVLGA